MEPYPRPDSCCHSIADSEEDQRAPITRPPWEQQQEQEQTSPLDAASENIRNVFSQVQACIESTSMQLQNDYQHRAAVYQTWRPPTTALRQPGSLGSSPRGSVGSLGWSNRQPPHSSMQQQESSSFAEAAGSFAEYFASRRSASFSNLDSPNRPAPMPFMQALVLDVRASREAAASGRPVTPMLLKRLLDPRPTPNLLLEKLRQQSGQQQQQEGGIGSGGAAGQQQQGPYSHSNISTHHLRSHSSCGTQNSAASVMTLNAAAGMPGVLSAGRGSSSVGELSLWSEPLNVSPVSPRRSAAALGSPGGMSSRAEGSFLLSQQQLQDRPQSPTILAMLGSERNIAPAVVTAAGTAGCWDANGGRCHFGSGSSPEQHRAGCRSRSCSPTAYRADTGQQQQQPGAASRSRSSSPQSRHLICCACRRQHSLQQHSKCCHLCGSCCKGRGTCGGKGSFGGGNMGSGRVGPMPAGAWPADAAGSNGGAAFGCQPGSLAAEGSASSTSTCPCVRAYKSGQRDASSSPVQQAAGGVSPQQHYQQAQQLLSRHPSRAGAPAQLGSSSGRLGDSPAAGSQSVRASAGQYSEAGSAAAAAVLPEVAGTDAGQGQGQDDLVQAAFLEVCAAQQNLMAQGPAADPEDVQELTQILQQVLPAAEPQHEALLNEVMARQQQLLALQERYAQEAEDGAAPWPQAEAPPLRLPSGLGRDNWDRSAAGNASSQQGQQEEQQQQGPSRGAAQDYDGLSTRTNSASSNWTGGASAQRQPASASPSNTNQQEHLQAYMSQEDRLAAVAAAYEAVSGGQKPLQQVLEASRGTAGSRSSRGCFASGNSTVDPHASQASTQQQMLPHGRQQEYGSSRSAQHSRRSTYEGEPVPAYTGGGCDPDLPELHGRPLVHYMTAEGSNSSRHVVQEAPSQVRGSCTGFERAGGSMTAATAAPAGRAPSNRSIADSAWSVQATPPASSNGGQQQQAAVHCATSVHAARDPEPWLSSVCFSAAPSAGAVAPSGAVPGQAGSSNSSMHHRRAASSSLVDQVSAVVPPLNLGGALDTETARLAGIAVDPRVMGLSPRLRGVDSASCLQELVAAVSGNGTAERPDSIRGRGSSSTDAGSEHELLTRRGVQQQQSVGGSAPSPRTPGRHLVGASSSSQVPVSASAAGPAAIVGAGHHADLGSSRCASLSHNTRSAASVRFQESSSGQQQQQNHHQQQQQQFKRTGSTRAGSFELPDSDPSSQEVSYRSLEGAHSQGDLSRSRQRAAAAAAHAAASRGVPAAIGSRPASPRTQQQPPLTSLQHSPTAQLLSPRQPSGSTLQHQQAPQQQLHQQGSGQHLHQQGLAQQLHQQASGQQLHQQACGSLSGGSSLLDLAARARVLASGGGSRHNVAPAGAAGTGAPSALGSPTGTQPRQQQQQPQQTQPVQHPEGRVSAAPGPSRPDSSSGWRERQLAMQQELAAQAQQLTRIRSRASSAATTPAAAHAGSTLRSMSRNSGVSSIASSMAGARTPRQHTQQQQQEQQLLQEGAAPQQQYQQQQQQLESRPESRQEMQAAAGGHEASHQQGQQEQQEQQQPGDGALQAEASCSSAGDGVFDGMLDAVLCDTLQQRREARLQKQALRGWKQYVAARKAKAARQQHPAPKTCQSPPISQSPQKQQPAAAAAADSLQPSSRPGSAGQSLRISLQGLNRAMLKQSLGQLLEGQLGVGHSDPGDGSAGGGVADSLEIVVSGQLRLVSPPRQRTPSPQRGGGRQPASSAGGASHRSSNGGSNGGSSDAHIRHFEEQLEATRAAVSAAAARSGRAPLQGVLRDMHTMVARMEAVCASSWQQGQGAPPGSTAAAAPGGSSPKQGSPVCRQQQQQCMHHQHQYMNATVASAGHSRSPHRVGASSSLGGSPAHYSSPQRLASSLGGGGPQTPKACSPGRSSPRRQAPPAPMPQQGAAGKLLRSPDRHKLRGRLHQVQDRLAKLEIKMNQASAMAEPCSCNAAGCVHRLNSSSAGGWAEQEWAAGDSVGGGTACCCSLQGKRAVLVGRMQQELEDLQAELANLHNMMPGAYSSSGGGGVWGM